MATTVNQPPSPPEPPARRRQTGSRWWYLLLLVPFIGTLWPAFYARATPTLGGFPFFYWYQFLMVLVGVAVTAAVYLATTRTTRRRADR